MRPWLVVDQNRKVYSQHFFLCFAKWKRDWLEDRATKPLKSILLLGKLHFMVIHKDQLSQ
ncbi:MAG: hypothetical protein OEX81_03000 [Candidatus Pacebacteria bacterium]|nr:hypothetical protein [Candidatus Paceibacterota bacterium]